MVMHEERTADGAGEQSVAEDPPSHGRGQHPSDPEVDQAGEGTDRGERQGQVRGAAEGDLTDERLVVGQAATRLGRSHGEQAHPQTTEYAADDEPTGGAGEGSDG